MAKTNLHEIGLKCRTDKATDHRYTEVFPNYMECYREYPIRFLEIGIKRGASLRMWDEYFEHEDAKLFAVDISSKTLRKVPENARWKGLQGNQSNPEFLAQLGEANGPFNIIVEDGSHDPQDQRACFKGLWPFVSLGGIYVIEDIYKSFTDRYQEDVSLNGFLQGVVRKLVVGGKASPKVSYDFVHYYKNMVVIGKKMRA